VYYRFLFYSIGTQCCSYKHIIGGNILKLKFFCIASIAILLLTATVLISAAQPAAKLEQAQAGLSSILAGKMWNRLWDDQEH
jgi:hypothetical protein